MTLEEYTAHCEYEDKVSEVLKKSLPHTARYYELHLDGGIFIEGSPTTNVFDYFGANRADWPRLVDMAKEKLDD